MAAEREVRVKLSVDGAQEYIDSMHAAAEATRRFDEARQGAATPATLNVRHGEHHGLPDSESTVDQWEVDPMPTTDFAARALREAQERMARDYPNAPTIDLIWTLRKRGDRD
ncbi:hypothetical protein [Microbacterium aurugineum]|uniref:hypothetical protein n=1 Tax=Microbacterium aurugineum TaxID=2851642 RepID=UPI0020BE518F|nr:hypothetical protein [Microbacterium aurugineum]MCK8477229.1 hypothetical protein [Microbacterium aurugineum]